MSTNDVKGFTEFKVSLKCSCKPHDNSFPFAGIAVSLIASDTGPRVPKCKMGSILNSPDSIWLNVVPYVSKAEFDSSTMSMTHGCSLLAESTLKACARSTQILAAPPSRNGPLLYSENLMSDQFAPIGMGTTATPLKSITKPPLNIVRLKFVCEKTSFVSRNGSPLSPFTEIHNCRTSPFFKLSEFRSARTFDTTTNPVTTAQIIHIRTIRLTFNTLCSDIMHAVCPHKAIPL